MYGVISNVIVEGGLSARSVVLNSLRSYGSGRNYQQESTNAK